MFIHLNIFLISIMISYLFQDMTFVTVVTGRAFLPNVTVLMSERVMYMILMPWNILKYALWHTMRSVPVSAPSVWVLCVFGICWGQCYIYGHSNKLAFVLLKSICSLEYFYLLDQSLQRCVKSTTRVDNSSTFFYIFANFYCF